MGAPAVQSPRLPHLTPTFCAPGGAALEALHRSVAAEPGLERSAADIYSTDEVRHGNLPCPCD
ncbi:MAG: hypothetical protein WA709_35020, partial [Stellaceae bacterium]